MLRHLFEVKQFCFIVSRSRILILRYATKGRKWFIPGGHLEENEEPMKGLIREMKEETGIALKDVHLYRIVNYSRNHKSILGLFYYSTPENDNVKLSPEHSDFSWVDSKDIEKYELSDDEPVEIIEEFFNEILNKTFY